MSLMGLCRSWARKAWKRRLSWTMRCRFEPIKKVAKTIEEHPWGILNAIVLKVGNGPAEGIAASRRSKSKAGDSVTNSVLPMPSTFRWA
uniref:Transposase n=1 Tax=Candidatus Kentrum sp. TC TaxID=2126339 RepID=A0A450Y9B8_9GAMM|nr:MAG: Transposase [Candidatus Kentron sp. TC]